MGRLMYKEIEKRKIKEKRNIVISETSNEAGELYGYSVTEQLVANEEGKEVRVFLKNSLGILSLDGLVCLRDALVEACEKLGVPEHIKVEKCTCEQCSCEKEKAVKFVENA